MPRRLPALLVALWLPSAAAAGGAPALLLPPALGRPEVVWIAGRVLEEAHGQRGPRPWRTARALAARNRPGAAVTVRLLGRSAQAVSGHDGAFEVELRPAPGEAFPPGSQRATVEVEGVLGEVRVEVVGPEARRLLVSDLDDTVVVTRVESVRRTLRAVFLEDAETQPVVPGMAALYRCLAPEGTPVAIVSGTPVQLAPRVARFLEKHGFPPAVLFLRNLGRGTSSGYKEPVLERLAARFPGLELVLVGDTGERDPEIYAAFAAAHPGRVAGILLRRAGPLPVGPGRTAGAVVFADAAEAGREAARRGLADEACVARAFP